MNDDLIRNYVRAAHGDLQTLQTILTEYPDIIDQAVTWRPGQTETALQAAAHTGGRAIAQYLLAQGAQANMVAYAMLGDASAFDTLHTHDPQAIDEIGAHDFSLMFHAALGGNLAIMQTIYDHARNPDVSGALQGAVMGKHDAALRWLVEQGADLSTTDFRGRTALEAMVEAENQAMIDYLISQMSDADLAVCDGCGARGYRYLAKIEGSLMGKHRKYFACKQCGATMAIIDGGE